MQGRLAAHRHGAGCQVVTVDGELDMLSASVLYGALATFSTHESVVIDCAGVDFMDSYGLEVIVRRRREMLDDGGSLALRRPSIEVMRILAACGTVEGLLEDEATERRLQSMRLHPALQPPSPHGVGGRLAST